MAEAWRLGNDVVDITAPRTRDKASDTRFLHRVFSPGEVDAMVASPLPDRSLWLFWAAKEAIFKSITKELGSPPVFNHPIFQARFEAGELRMLAENPHPDVEPPTLRGTGTYMDWSFGLRARWTREHIHALAWLQGPHKGVPDVHWKVVANPAVDRSGLHGEPGEMIRDRFTPDEWECVSHERSAACRIEARRAVAANLGVAERRVEIRCGPGTPGRRIPQTYLDGRPVEMDLTLSHDGPFLARAFLRTAYRPQGR